VKDKWPDLFGISVDSTMYSVEDKTSANKVVS